MLMSVDQKDTIDVSVNKPDGTNDLYPRFSPDGAWIVFINAPNYRSSAGDMWIMRRDGTGRTRAMERANYADWK
jgi:TolB protein